MPGGRAQLATKFRLGWWSLFVFTVSQPRQSHHTHACCATPQMECACMQWRRCAFLHSGVCGRNFISCVNGSKSLQYSAGPDRINQHDHIDCSVCCKTLLLPSARFARFDFYPGYLCLRSNLWQCICVCTYLFNVLFTYMWGRTR